MKSENFREKGSPRVHLTILCVLCPFNISAIAGARNLKFGTQIDHEAHCCKKMKMWVKTGRQGVK